MQDIEFQVVFIPGLLLTKDLFDAQIADIPAGLAYHIADTTGCDSITAMAKRVLAQTTSDIVVIGLSMGGYVALEIARLAASRVKGIALLSTNAAGDSKARGAQRREMMELSKLGKFKGVTSRLLPRLLSGTARQNPEIVARVQAMAVKIGRDNFLLQQSAIMNRRDQRPHLLHLQMPALVACGLDDVMTPPEQSKDMAELLPDVELQLFEGVGHLSALEAPALVNAALRRLYARAGFLG